MDSVNYDEDEQAFPIQMEMAQVKDESGAKAEAEEMESENDAKNSSNGRHVLKQYLNKVDRKTACPSMIKMYCRINGHHRLEDFSPPRFPVDDELIVYTWRDATLQELSLLVRNVLKDMELPGGIQSTDPALKFSFKLLFPDNSRSGRFISRPMGWAFDPEVRSTAIGIGSGNGSSSGFLKDSSNRTLASYRFKAGDFIDVAIYTNPALIPRQ